jgi:sec-independent protein translocase protein TatC
MTPHATLHDDLFAHTRMSFGDHIEDLRRHLWRAIIGLVAILILVFVFDGVGLATGTRFGIGRPMMAFIIQPVQRALQGIYDTRMDRALKDVKIDGTDAATINQLADTTIQIDIRAEATASARAQGLPDPTFPGFGDGPIFKEVPVRFEPVILAYKLAKAQRLLGQRPSMTTFTPMEAMVVYCKVALACGVILASPWIFWQLWSFLVAGLYPQEKKYVHYYLPFSLVLFLAGVALCEFVVMPQAVGALLWFNEWLNIEANMRLDDWLSFAIWMPVIFGASFQLPLVMLFLERLGITTIDFYRGKRRIAIFALAVIAVLILPTIDISNMCMLWIPMCLLYELGIVLCKLSARKDGWGSESPVEGELVEV